MSESTKLDAYLDDAGPAALVLQDELVSVEGPDGVVFPPTYAAGDNFPGGYNIDGDLEGENVCLIDSVGAQANRIEPMFGRAPYAELVPQINIRAGDRVVSILEAGHRAGDAVVRCSPLQEELQKAFKALLKGDAEPLARVAPTSLVFGVWDSRDTQAKAPRLLASTIRARNVRKLTRSAQYVPAIDYVGQELLEEPTEKPMKSAYSERGFVHVPASASHGGVIAKGGIRRDATLSLAALRLLTAGNAPERTRALRRYLLGIAVTAFTANVSGYLRQGCNLVLDASKPQPRRIEEVYPSGERKPFTLSHEEALAYAQAAAKAFGVGESRAVDFDKERARRDVAGDGEKKAKGKKAKG
ncbi:type I-G CRISPR-associated RAMP protein Csb1/Cas7g [Sorangium sp. So ce1024]|uniref:type I-G CRISPR-associated RAMP protein Csb1/Cas7g n=1 Tax=Sorangium sp. So ce1024 TaxID=3133327 RepID=UPI003F02537A